MLKNRLCYLAGLALAVLFYLYYPAALSLLTLCTAAALPLLSLALGIAAGWRSTLTLEVPGELPRDTEARVLLRLTGAKSGQRTVFRLRQENLFTGQTARSGPLELRHGRESVEMPLLTGHCGAVRCTVERPRALDVLGLFALRVDACPPACVLVLPTARAPVPLPPLPRPAELAPRPGGGPGEEHELRPFRPGDPLRSVHWKVSAKMDETIVREPLEPRGQSALMELELWGDPGRMDAVLDHFVYLSDLLLDRGIAYWAGAAGQKAVLLRDREAVQAWLTERLSTRAPGSQPAPAPRPNAGWVYRVSGKREPVTEKTEP